ncbi:hypothetical protein HanLR1_Chr13g0506211 [Helianthus annuus]|nr:hypothetical protein HanHA89_Chr13g0536261 [Helianthus annuus]KAJ0665653.1 hypothetical protein HanLR1_Chr13g0506211 [Helianthus annuus]
MEDYQEQRVARYLIVLAHGFSESKDLQAWLKKVQRVAQCTAKSVLFTTRSCFSHLLLHINLFINFAGTRQNPQTPAAVFLITHTISLSSPHP